MAYTSIENTNLVDNLLRDSRVEIAVAMNGLGPCQAGEFPRQRASPCDSHAAVRDLTVRDALKGNRAHVYHAAMLDRHAASILSLDEINAVVDERIVAHGKAMLEGIRTNVTRATL